MPELKKIILPKGAKPLPSVKPESAMLKRDGNRDMIVLPEPFARNGHTSRTILLRTSANAAGAKLEFRFQEMKWLKNARVTNITCLAATTGGGNHQLWASWLDNIALASPTDLTLWTLNLRDKNEKYVWRDMPLCNLLAPHNAVNVIDRPFIPCDINFVPELSYVKYTNIGTPIPEYYIAFKIDFIPEQFNH